LRPVRSPRSAPSPLLAVPAPRGFVPDSPTPPPRTPWPRLRAQLAEIRSTSPAQVAHELKRCRATVHDEPYGLLVDAYMADPARARDQLADRIHEAWTELVAPFWLRIRTLLQRDIDKRSQTLARHGFRRVLDELHPRIRWTKRGLSCADRSGVTVEVDERGLVLMPSAYMWQNVAAIVDAPWLPTLAYPARGIDELWRTPTPPP